MSRNILSAITAAEILNEIWPPRKSNDLFQYHSKVIIGKKMLSELFCPPILELQRSLEVCDFFFQPGTYMYANVTVTLTNQKKLLDCTVTLTNQKELLVGKNLQGLSTPSQSCQ